MGEKPVPSQAATAPNLPLTETERLALAGMADLRPALMLPIMIQVVKSRLHLAGEIRAIFKRRLVGAQLADALAQLDALLPQPEPAPVAAANPYKLPDCTAADLLKHVNTVINPLRPAAPKAALLHGWMDWAARYDAFDKIRWNDIFPPADPVEQPDESPVIRLDAESGRLLIGLHLEMAARIWAIAREQDRERYQGRGYISRDELWSVVQALNLSPRRNQSYTRQHFNFLLRQGDGIFWGLNDSIIHLRKPERVAANLVKYAKTEKPGLVETNLPGGFRPVYLPVNGSCAEWEALIYAGWIAAKGDLQINYRRLAALFGRSAKTLRRWEQRRLQGIITKTPAYKQTADPDEPRPAGAREYIVNGETRWAWQTSNIFCSSIRQHPHKGRARKIRVAARESAGLRPDDVMGVGNHSGQRQYFDSAEKLRKTVKKHGVGVGRHLFLGISRLGNARFEPTANGYTRTTAEEFGA